MHLKVLGIIGNNLPSLEKTGQLSRFTDYYLKYYSEQFDRIYIFSEPCKISISDHDGKCIVLKPRWKMPWLLYQFFLSFVHKEFRQCDLIRVMQMINSLPAIIARFWLQIPYVATYGYDYASLVWLGTRCKFLLLLKYLYVKVVLKLGIKFAKMIIVTAPEIRNTLCQKVKQDRIFYSPNGVDVARFVNSNPDNVASPYLRCVFVGRLEFEKNLFMLFDALALLKDIPIKLSLIGDGSLRAELAEYAAQKKIEVQFYGVQSHNRLPELLCQHDVFILPSFSEGHPKALLEAMSCSLACIGSNVPGINTLIRHGETGLLSNLTSEAFASSILKLIHNKSLREKVSKEAQEFIKQNFDLNILLRKEAVFLRSITK